MVNLRQLFAHKLGKSDAVVALWDILQVFIKELAHSCIGAGEVILCHVFTERASMCHH